MGDSGLMTFYPSELLPHLFTNGIYNQLVTAYALLIIYWLVRLTLRKQFNQQLDQFVSMGLLKKINYLDLDPLLKKLKQLIRLTQITAIIMIILTLVTQFELVARITQLAFGFLVLIVFIFQARVVSHWQQQKTMIKLNFKVVTDQSVAYNQLYRTYLIYVIVSDVFWLPVCLLVMDLINIAVYLF